MRLLADGVPLSLLLDLALGPRSEELLAEERGQLAGGAVTAAGDGPAGLAGLVPQPASPALVLAPQPVSSALLPQPASPALVLQPASVGPPLTQL
jgi:hypothetical protein